MLVITAGMDQKECYVSPCRKLRTFRSCNSSTRPSISLSWRKGFFPWSRRTIEIPQLLLDKVVEVPVLWTCRFFGAGVEETVVFPQLQLVDNLVAVFISLFTCLLFATTDAVWFNAQKKNADFPTVAPLQQDRPFPCRGAVF